MIIEIDYEGDLCPSREKDRISKYPARKTGKHFLYLTKRYTDSIQEFRLKTKHLIPKGFFNNEILVCEIHIYYAYNADVDNFNKMLLDAMEGVAYTNDKQIRRLINEKHKITRDMPTRANIKIFPIVEPGTLFNNP